MRRRSCRWVAWQLTRAGSQTRACSRLLEAVANEGEEDTVKFVVVCADAAEGLGFVAVGRNESGQRSVFSVGTHGDFLSLQHTGPVAVLSGRVTAANPALLPND